MSRAILGVNSAYHESSAALLVDGELVAFVEEERFNRVRHGKKSRLDNPDELPEAAMAWCLAQAGLGFRDLAAIGYSFDPEARLVGQRTLPDRTRLPPGGWGTEEGEAVFHAHNLKAAAKLRERAPQAEFQFLGHHLCHAASAYLASPFERAAVLVVDGIGELNSTWLGAGDGAGLTGLEEVPYPHSLGFVWEKFSEYLGFDVYSGPGKVMGYAALSDPIGELTGRDHLAALRQALHPVPDGTFFVDNEAFRFRTDDFRGLERLFGPRRQQPVDRYEDASVASALQELTTEILVHLARRAQALAESRLGGPVTDLCLAGGVTLNCVANYELAARTGFKRLWVQPAANDAGTALGAALLLHHARGGGARVRMEHAYWGPGYDEAAMRAALEAKGLSPARPANLPAEVARRIERGEIVAWFEGRQEIGPRALGHRSIVADPSRFDTRNRINTRVKYRESFRPFAPSVLPEALTRFFLTPADMVSARYMLFALPLRDRRDLQVLPAVIQENASTGQATARVHLVEREHSPAYAAMIDEFKGLTGLPVVLNTSFNISEPIVTTPNEAVATFLRSSMDALAMGPFLVERPKKA
ncbi:MAG TPA: carbamoyltransferase C-terminal domain-containing protein [Myxococcota bacterium]|nr:carbamoyltransferase C-terminal domain-containing protein [Myxococcota bacterium]HRY95290.1 carbamoyltransferase C-terminal domain-containing protein [Myxococcota bacterium]HSA20886.1 carbamoyltransferase C-terminal domain-containing protein [Myxococcota bacterium]